MPVIICYKEDGIYNPGVMLRVATQWNENLSTYYWVRGNSIRREEHWRLAKDLELDIWYGSMAIIPETLKKFG